MYRALLTRYHRQDVWPEAKLIVDPKTPVIDCRVIDYSPGGACIELSGQIKLPDRFELLFGRTRKRCRTVWRAGRRLGVAF